MLLYITGRHSALFSATIILMTTRRWQSGSADCYVQICSHLCGFAQCPEKLLFKVAPLEFDTLLYKNPTNHNPFFASSIHPREAAQKHTKTFTPRNVLFGLQMSFISSALAQTTAIESSVLEGWWYRCFAISHSKAIPPQCYVYMASKTRT